MGDELRPRQAAESGAFQRSSGLRRQQRTVDRALSQLALQDLHEVKLLLRGESVVDWHRLYLSSEDEARRILALAALDADDPDDQRRMASVRAQAVEYVRSDLRLHLDEEVATQGSMLDLLLLASREGKLQRSACVLLKVMHLMYHLDARELRTALAIPDQELFALVEESVVAMFDELRSAGVPVAEFSWSRKTRSSQLTKLLVKKATVAAQIFDRLRFRVVVEHPSDLAATLHVMLHQCIPFNYVLPGQTVNNLVDMKRLDPVKTLEVADDDDRPLVESNEFTSDKFRVLNFVADLPIRVDEMIAAQEGAPEDRGSVVFVLAEFQVLDKATADANEQGESAHHRYKYRQHGRVKERLLRTPVKGKK